MNSGKSQRTHLRIRTLVRNARAVALHHLGKGLVEAAGQPPVRGYLEFLGYESGGIPLCCWEPFMIVDGELRREIMEAWMSRFYPEACKLKRGTHPRSKPFFVFGLDEFGVERLTLRHGATRSPCRTCLREGGHYEGCPQGRRA